MKAEEHKATALRYNETGKQNEELMNKEQNTAKKKACMIVSAQNYFYAGIEAIEFILSNLKVPLHSANHEHRQRNVNDNIHAFSNELIRLNNEVDLKRRDVAYRGENGEKFRLMKKFAEQGLSNMKDG